MYLPGGSGSFCNLIQVDLCKRDGFRLLLLHLHHLWSMQDPFRLFLAWRDTNTRSAFLYFSRKASIGPLYVQYGIRRKFSKAYVLYSFAYVLHYSWMSRLPLTESLSLFMKKKIYFKFYVTDFWWIAFLYSICLTAINITTSASDIPCTLFPQLSDFHSYYTYSAVGVPVLATNHILCKDSAHSLVLWTTCKLWAKCFLPVLRIHDILVWIRIRI